MVAFRAFRDCKPEVQDARDATRDRCLQSPKRSQMFLPALIGDCSID